MIKIRSETNRDAVAREALLDEALGPARFAKAAQRLRDGRLPADRLSFIACDDRKVVGTVRFLARLNLEGKPLDVRKLVHELRRDPNLRFRVTDEVLEQAIATAGEPI